MHSDCFLIMFNTAGNLNKYLIGLIQQTSSSFAPISYEDNIETGRLSSMSSYKGMGTKQLQIQSSHVHIGMQDVSGSNIKNSSVKLLNTSA